jgi:signal transduction histidine kinase/DNA-binding NarL/FixJ family response regulator
MTNVQQASQLLDEHQQSVYKRTDRTFAVLMVVQWVAIVLAALWISPRAWAGTSGSLHPHVVAALLLGGIITALPVFLALTLPGRTITRHVIAVAQMLISALLIHLTGGRIETHFHVFGSLAFLACYRDWRVLVSATIVIVADHLIRGIVWPFSVYGVLSAPVWRSFEHGGWVVFEDIFLCVAIRQSVAEMRNVAMVSQAKSETAAELSRSEEALRNQTQILESVLTSMGDGVVVADCDGKFLLFNPAAEQILRTGRTETQPEQWTEKYGVYLVDTITPCPVDHLPLVRAIRGEATDAAEFFIRHSPQAEGDWISVNGRPLKDTRGALLGGVVVFRDITSAKRSEDALHKAKLVAEAANRSKSEFLANMSHEIRTPLSSILGFTELLRRGIGSKDEINTHLETIHSSGRHLSALIDDILDLSKIEAGRMEFDRVCFSPHQIITEVLSVLRVRAQEKSLSLEGRWTSGVPETILTDPARLRQLLMNLVGNAIKFTERGGVKLLATVVPDFPEPRFQIEVHDTGIGIPAERIDSIFCPFEQADSSITRRFGGTGLGLAISRHIAEGLGGEITVESEAGRGSVFRVKLATGPLEHVRMLESPPTEALTPADAWKPGSVPKLSAARVLLVEDGQSNRELISLVLQEAGAEVTCAENGQEGLETASRGQFDLILMDIQMPVMDGHTATRRLRERGCMLPIIALTAHAMRGDREKCLAAGCSRYLTKPIDIDELLWTVADALSKKATKAERLPEQASGGNATQIGSSDSSSAITSTLPTDNPNFRPIVESFVNRLHERLDEMRAARAEADWNQLAELAHWLRGSGGTVGFRCFTEPAQRLEQLAKARQIEKIDEVMQEISALVERIAVPA